MRKIYKLYGRKQLQFFFLCLIMVLSTLVFTARAEFSRMASSGRKPTPVYSVETQENQMALTFNCAWSNEDIPELLKILEEHQVKATFFLVGQWAEKFPESVKAIYQAGHELGNHSYSHKDFAKISKEEIVQEIQKCNDVIEAITGTRPKLMRPPSGSYHSAAVETIQECGMLPVQWSLDSVDWKDPTPEKIRERVADKGQKGDIALFHSGKKNTVEALPQVIEELQKKGLELCPVGEFVLWEKYTIDVQGKQHPEKEGQ